ncbi:hypothetical protein EIP91_008435 [Steccherinum ochraceum]|uniref:Uncharacterized protein n=1 Tax=Steccherinum ochraceum TaxID=92696 RepID=A0A4V2MV80_9APHY|nr:hypothetical protein EIP91_008435 [Steccherinum ochraceum]
MPSYHMVVVVRVARKLTISTIYHPKSERDCSNDEEEKEEIEDLLLAYGSSSFQPAASSSNASNFNLGNSPLLPTRSNQRSPTPGSLTYIQRPAEQPPGNSTQKENRKADSPHFPSLRRANAAARWETVRKFTREIEVLEGLLREKDRQMASLMNVGAKTEIQNMIQAIEVLVAERRRERDRLFDKLQNPPEADIVDLTMED